MKECLFVRQSSVNAKATGSLKTTSEPCQDSMQFHQIKYESLLPRKNIIAWLGVSDSARDQ